MADTTRTLEVRIESFGEDALKSIAEHFGAVAKSGDKADKSIRKVARSSKKAEKDAGDLATMFRDMDGVGLRLGDTIDQLGVLLSGPLGLAIGGAVIGFGGLAAAVGGTTAAVGLYIESNDKLDRSLSGVVNSFKAMVANFGRAAVGGTKLMEVFEALAQVFDDASDSIVKDSSRIHGVFKDIALGAIEVARPFAMVGATLGGMADVIGDAFDLTSLRLKRFVNTVKFTTLQAVAMVKTGVEAVKLAASGGSVEEIEALIKRGKFGVDALGRVRNETDRAIEMKVEATAGNLVKSFRRSIGAAADVDTAFNEARNKTAAFFDKPIGGPSATAADFADSKKGKGKKAGAVTGESLDVLSTRMDLAAHQAQGAVVALSKVDAIGQVLKDTFNEVGESVALGLGGIAGEVASTLGAFAAGTGTISDFGDAILDSFGSLAGQLGQFFVKTGTAMLFMPGGVGAGAGLIAGGLALQAFGGLLGGKGSGNKGSGSGRGGAGPSASAFTPIDPRRQDKTREDTINITIEGDTIARAVDNSARRGVMRHVQVRMA